MVEEEESMGKHNTPEQAIAAIERANAQREATARALMVGNPVDGQPSASTAVGPQYNALPPVVKGGAA